MEPRDYYQVLGVDRSASEKEIRAAYRKLARQYHPDVNPGDKQAEARFKEIGEAYEVLSNPETRRKYDELGPRWREAEAFRQAQETARARRGAPRPPYGAEGAPGGFQYEYRTGRPEDFEDLFGTRSPFSDFFETHFSRGPRRRAATPGADLEQPLEVSLAEAYRGAKRILHLQTTEGAVRRLEVTIPPGVDTGSRVRIAGQGAPGLDDGPPGDLYLVVGVQPDPRFERDGADLRTKVKVPLSVAVLGGEARVPTPDGRSLALTIPPLTQDGRVFRLRGQGMPRLGEPSRRGDLYAEIHLGLPERPTPRQRELLEELARLDTRAQAGASQ